MSLFQKSFKPANSWFDRLTPNGLEPETFVLSLSKNEIRRLMKHPPVGAPPGRVVGDWRGCAEAEDGGEESGEEGQEAEGREG